MNKCIQWIFIFISIFPAICFAEDFHESRQWLNLLYYEKTGTTYKSIADDSRFFVSPSGKTNPEQEYDVSLKLVRENNQDFKRRFPLRYKRITEYHNLTYDPVVTPNHDITSALIAFPNRYMGNPSSMFGHLFIILKSKHGLMDSDILHYLADTAGSDQYAYILNGLTGHFKGFFLREPFYKKIKDYNYVEDRDITYYDLALSISQIQDLQLHAIELKQSYFDYYFLDENCAFFMGKLLNVVTEKDIVSRSTFIFPSQIINTLHQQGLLTEEYKRKSSTKLFNNSFHQLSENDQKEVVSMLLTPTDTPPTDPNILKTFLYITEYLINNQSQLAQTIRHNRIQAYQQLEKTNQSRVRSLLYKQEQVTPIASQAWNAGYGFFSQGNMAYHPIYYSDTDTFDTLEVKKLNILSSQVVLSSDQAALATLTLVDIANIAPYNDILATYSWKLNSLVAYRNALFSNHSFELGQAHRIWKEGLVFGFLGFNYSNYNLLLDEELDALRLTPSITLGIENPIIPGILNTRAAYDYKFGHHYISGTLALKIFHLFPELTYIQSNNRQGLRISIRGTF